MPPDRAAQAASPFDPTDRPADNVSAAEIAKFESMAERWWDPDGEFKPLHKMNPVRANYIDLRAPVAGRQVLDVGCGGGLLSEALTQRGAQVTGIDMGTAPLQVARAHAQSQGLDITYRQMTAEALAEQQPAHYDTVTCLEMLEHVPDPASIIRACSRLVKPGGHLFFSTINRTPLAYATTVLGAEYVLRWLPKGTHEYRHFIRPAELCAWGRQSGLWVEDIRGIEYNPFGGDFRIGNRVQVNYIVHMRKPESTR